MWHGEVRVKVMPHKILIKFPREGRGELLFEFKDIVVLRSFDCVPNKQLTTLLKSPFRKMSLLQLILQLVSKDLTIVLTQVINTLSQRKLFSLFVSFVKQREIFDIMSLLDVDFGEVFDFFHQQPMTYQARMSRERHQFVFLSTQESYIIPVVDMYDIQELFLVIAFVLTSMYFYVRLRRKAEKKDFMKTYMKSCVFLLQETMLNFIVTWLVTYCFQTARMELLMRHMSPLYKFYFLIRYVIILLCVCYYLILLAKHGFRK